MQQLPKRPQITISTISHTYLSHITTHNAQCYLTKTHCTITHQLNIFNTIKVNPNDTFSNSRLKLFINCYPNQFYKKIHLKSFLTLRTAAKTDLRFERYEFLKFRKFFIFQHSMYQCISLCVTPQFYLN